MACEKWLIVALLAGCGSSGQKMICKPVPSFSSPAVSCVAMAEPKPPPPKPEPEPEEPKKEPEPEPEPTPPPVVVKREEIELDRTVQFEPNSAKLIEDSKSLLDEVAKALEEHPEVKQVQIGGHTDSRMSTRHNKKLSKQRAMAVRAYLVDKGINRDRLVAMGFGEEKPIADNATWKGRFQNRRVELKITKRDDSAEPKDSAKEGKEGKEGKDDAKDDGSDTVKDNGKKGKKDKTKDKDNGKQAKAKAESEDDSE